ncbi:beta-1,3-glucanosyltransferase [Ophiocordyceps sinensis CO18]|uniref:1,3-beta-glucanosyltransferase n=1 Tax=Ophiocordyceps sinensis (strain Co18 / CGMCC 3.14243) TaxID=911162 RepID=T5AIM3_OPHSC|nr:beta-1,3-glucanosyltransferase [Ophiocordyceps sinensis CO18]
MAFAKLSLSVLALAGGVLAADLEPIEMKGSKFFYKNGTQFFMKGVAYQQDTGAAGATSEQTSKYIDPLADADNCKRDIPFLKELGTNTIRTYAINPESDHSACMKMLQEAGIYVVSDLGEPSLSINRDNPQWSTELYTRYTKVVDELGQYSNVIGFFAGNEVSNNKSNTDASAFVKAAVRDTKAYIKNKKNSRWMGVGYAANDDAEIRKDIADYFNCGKEEDAIDFWGYNIYSWCGKSDMKKSGYSTQAKFFEEYSVPVFFAEYGCNVPGGASERIFEETAALYEDEMTKVFSGGIVYMYFQEDNDYGLVKVSGNKATKQDDFKALQEQVTSARPKGVERDSYNPTNKPQACPDSKSESWKANSALPPTPDQSLCDCMSKSRTCVQKKGISTKDYGSIFGFICGEAPEICTGIQGNASRGVYGAYSMCSDSAKLDYVLDAYYVKMKKSPDACDFKGKAGPQSGSPQSSCSDKLARASEINKQVATATAPVGGGAATSTSDSFAVPGATMARLFTVGDYAMGLYMAVALVAGAGMLAL